MDSMFFTVIFPLLINVLFLRLFLSAFLSDLVLHIPFDDKEVSKMLWHYRLGHLSVPCLQSLKHDNSKIKVPTDAFCSICPLAKQYIEFLF